MEPRTNDDDNATSKLAAALVYVDEHRKWKQSGRKGPPPTQAAVAARLEAGLGRKLSQSTVSRWLGDTENRYWVRQIEGINDRIEAAPRLAAARELAFPANVAARIRAAISSEAARRLLSVSTVATPAGDGPGESARASGVAFAQAAMGRVIDLLATGERWGVTWGHNVGCVIGEIVKDPANRAAFAKAPRVVPLCGDPFDVVPTSESSSVLAEQLDVYLNGEHRQDLLSLRNVPSYIPGNNEGGFTRCEIAGIKKFVLRCKAYQRIFGVSRFQLGARIKRTYSGTPLADQLDGILTSVSSDQRTFLYGPATMIPMTQSEQRWLNANAFDIAGVCLARSSSDGKSDPLLARLRVQWTGVTLEQLEACAERACRKRGPASPPGVVVVAIGVQKANSVAECLRLGLINHLICSADLAGQLETLF